jgi:glycosyltransferase involved in cell wall biosynthesis
MNEHPGKKLMECKISAAMVEPVGGHGGAHYYDFGLARGLLAVGCRVSLYTCDETADPVISGLGFYPLYRHIYGNGSLWLRALHFIGGTLAALKKAVASGEIIWHYQVFNVLMKDIVVITLAKLFRRKVVLTVHDVNSVNSLSGPATWKSKITGWVYQRADRIIVHNMVSQRELESLGVPSAKIRVIAHGNYLDSMREMGSPAEARRALGISESAKVVLFFGQIKDTKGLDLLIEALPEVAREVPEVVLLIAGRPLKTRFESYEALIDKLGVRARCRLHIGYVPDDEVAAYHAAADLVALPYRRIYQSGVLIMAMTYGRPVVVSDLPGMTEIITNGVNGYVFPQGSKDALARTLISALRDGKESQRVAARASEYIRKYHNWNSIGRETAELYDSVLAL